mgnify:CR=1 FL=1
MRGQERAKNLEGNDDVEGGALARDKPGNHHNQGDGAGQGVRGRDIEQVGDDLPPGEPAAVA